MSKNYTLELNLPQELNAAQQRVLEGTEIVVTRGEGYVGPLTDAELKLAKSDPYITIVGEKAEKYPKVVDSVRYFRDGDAIFAVDDATFENIQESVTGYGATEEEALAMLRDPKNIKLQEAKIAENEAAAKAKAEADAAEKKAAEEKAAAEKKAAEEATAQKAAEDKKAADEAAAKAKAEADANAKKQ